MVWDSVLIFTVMVKTEQPKTIMFLNKIIKRLYGRSAFPKCYMHFYYMLEIK